MSAFYNDPRASDVAALRLELSSLRARQEVLADALAAAGDELEKLQSWRSRAEIAEIALEDVRAEKEKLAGLADGLIVENERLRAALEREKAEAGELAAINKRLRAFIDAYGHRRAFDEFVALSAARGGDAESERTMRQIAHDALAAVSPEGEAR